MISLICYNFYLLNVLRIEEVTKQYNGVLALDSISIEIPKGSIYGLLGPNGAGKTSLIRIINQITQPDNGSVYLDGELLCPSHISQIGYLPEERGLYKNMRVGEQAMYLARLKGLSKKEAKTRLLYWFDKFGIRNWWDKKIQELSKGMAQKVQFIVTVMHRPKLLIFDEPFSGFDPVNAELIANEILQLRNEGATIIFSTHRMESIEQMCDHICLLNKGKIVLEGTVAALQQLYGAKIYEIVFKTNNTKEVLSFFVDAYELRNHNYDEVSAILKLEVAFKENERPSDLMQNLLPFGELMQFVQKLPSMHAIFLDAIGKTDMHS